ncbi:keratin, type II cytoskeletal 2 epidermal-like isoform X2 [Lethenteron reissneri]|uniref:keratin, type II cytoskeletal 2 epidermal-like isoform X2 n=1 Tax=Lethenteron reissneri TaxID=7753 RepID=UPI002AB7EA24|nr:keratin, type II cytoskeletal 2 epidermal-like isoform X2 [Lethenteron reissneri]
MTASRHSLRFAVHDTLRRCFTTYPVIRVAVSPRDPCQVGCTRSSARHVGIAASCWREEVTGQTQSSSSSPRLSRRGCQPPFFPPVYGSRHGGPLHGRHGRSTAVLPARQGAGGGGGGGGGGKVDPRIARGGHPRGGGRREGVRPQPRAVRAPCATQDAAVPAARGAGGGGDGGRRRSAGDVLQARR